MGQIGSKWIKVDQNGSKRIKVVQNLIKGQKWMRCQNNNNLEKKNPFDVHY